QYPLSETRFEQSALSRVMEQGAPGDHWQLSTATSENKGHTVKYYYDPLRREAKYSAAIDMTTGERSLFRNNFNDMYALNELARVGTFNENISATALAGGVFESTDREGRVVMKRTFNKNGTVTDTLSTYYVYDKFGNLSFVLPPGANPDVNAPVSQQTLDDFCYQYKYDGKNRLIEKKVPGKGWETIIYNKIDQVVFTQDAEQAKTTGSPYPYRSFTKYDALGRIIMTGREKNQVDSRAAVQNTVNNWGVLWESRTSPGNHGYTNISIPNNLTGIEVEVVNFYDDYAIPGIPDNQSASFSKMTRGLLTATKKKVLGSADHFLWTVNYYDDESKLVRVWQQHYKGGVLASNNYDQSDQAYNFSGQVTSSVRKHFVSGVENLYVKNDFTYDARGRLIDTYQTTGSSSGTTANMPVLLARDEYNEVGQLLRKRLHSTDAGLTFKQNVSYTYNERGWLKSLSSPLFSEALRYQEVPAGVTPQYNGNISRQEWGTSKYYNYEYDAVNRLKSAISSTGNNELIGYDFMGNITRLQRKQNNALIDQIRYNYAGGNRLVSVLDSNSNASAAFQLPGTTTYTYDLNGSMASRNNIANTVNNLANISYNHLSLPVSMTSGGSAITYTYDATGAKLRKVFGASVNNDYISGIHYEGGIFAFAQTAVGRVVKNGTGTDPGYSYEYTLADHLGNGRVYFDINAGVARKVQETEYFAFGMSVNVGSVLGTENKYLYNGKEKQDQEKMFDYGARFYDPVIGRWNVVDPLAAYFEDVSPYNYANNNPIVMVDPDGMASEEFKSLAQEKPKPQQKPIQLEEVVITSKSKKGLIAVTHWIFGTRWTTYRLPDQVVQAIRAEDLAFLGRWTPLGKTITALNSLLEIESKPLKFEKPIGKLSRVSKGETRELKEKGYDPHSVKPSQGGPGKKIDLWKDRLGNLFYRTEGGSHYEPLYDNIYQILK
ncbi:MAG TPA: RHS repeat-associated core domain-containing protein, partial [Pedobacter sp.]|nr:RHS repeat-associated core domain-containing protein [Pedobacter sp.]